MLYDEEEFDLDLEEDWFDLETDTAICNLCGYSYCLCCGCDCLFEENEDLEENGGDPEGNRGD